MAKGDKQEVARAKKAVNKRKENFAKIGKTPKQGLQARVKAEKIDSQMMKNVARDKGNKLTNKILRGGILRVSSEKTQGRNFKTESGKMVNAPKGSTGDIFKKGNELGSWYPTSKKGGNTNSPVKPSVASKANAKNKMKAQGAKIMGSPTSGYGKSTKPKGK